MSNKKTLMKGNDALAEAAIRAGCRYYFGYPITPQNEIPAYMSKRLPQVGGVFIQAESELASISMVFGAGSCGARVMTSSSSPGISLMQEGISYIAGAEVPAVIVNMMRGGPGLGNIAGSQADYFQAVKGGGHGDYKIIVIAPSTVQEIVDLTSKAFDLAMKYRNTVMILGDGILGQMAEPVIIPDFREINDDDSWAIANNSDKDREQVIIRSLYLSPENRLEKHNIHLQEKFRKIEEDYVEYEEYKLEDYEYIIVAYGTISRVCRVAVDLLNERGIKIGLFRPISLWPFPKKKLNEKANKSRKVFVAEMAHAQLEEDVRLAVNGKSTVRGFYKLGGATFFEEELVELIMNEIS